MKNDSNAVAGAPECEKLARRLYERMEELDPSIDAIEWNDLPYFDRELYRKCVVEVLCGAQEIGFETCQRLPDK